MWHETGQASLFNNDKVPSDGISLDANIADKPARAKELILDYTRARVALIFRTVVRAGIAEAGKRRLHSKSRLIR